MFQIGEKISFYCGGGRGGHNVAHCAVIKINRKTILLQENQNSYTPGQTWRCNMEWLKDNLTAKSMTIPGFNERFM
jgi:hypothetical protein